MGEFLKYLCQFKNQAKKKIIKIHMQLLELLYQVQEMDQVEWSDQRQVKVFLIELQINHRVVHLWDHKLLSQEINQIKVEKFNLVELLQLLIVLFNLS